MNFPKISPTLTLPSIVAVVGMIDAGPSLDNDGPRGICPHCGAEGRRTFVFICADGTKRGAMSGCIKLFPESPHPEATRLASEAFTRRSNLKPGQKLAGWWEKMIEISEAFGRGEVSVDEWKSEIYKADGSRRDWLRRKGYFRGGSRRSSWRS